MPHETWDTPQRARYLCERLSDRCEIHVCDFIAFRKATDYLSTRLPRSWVYRQRREGGIWLHRIPRLSPTIFHAGLRRLNCAIMERYVNRIVRQFGIDVVVATAGLRPRIRRAKVVFDIFDANPAYWREFRRNEVLAREIELIERWFIRDAQAVVAASTVLKDAVAGLRPDVVWIPNGFDPQRILGGQKEVARAALGLQGEKLVGFIGQHGEFSGLLKVVEAAHLLHRRDIVFLIAGGGREVGPAQARARQWGLDNFRFLGHLHQVKDFFAAIDVGLIPSYKSLFRDSASPIKLFEYTAAGLPVVSTDLEEVRRLAFPNVLLVDESAEALAEGIVRALDWRPEFPDMSRFTWQKLAGDYYQLICSLL